MVNKAVATAQCSGYNDFLSVCFCPCGHFASSGSRAYGSRGGGGGHFNLTAPANLGKVGVHGGDGNS